MTPQVISESGMSFGPYPDEHFFYIEKSKIYSKICENVSMAEFLLLKFKEGKPPVVWVVEAKSSSPKPETIPDFNYFIMEIREKLVNAFALGWASCLGRHKHSDAELPKPFKELDLSKVEVRFVLVINGHQEEWLPPLQEALKKALHCTVRTWSFSPTSVVVINEVLAREYGLIRPVDGDDA